MSTHGWYFECGSVQGEGDRWDMVEEGVTEAADCDRLHALRVGPMVDSSSLDYLDFDDLRALHADGELDADAVVRLLTDRHADCVCEGRAALTGVAGEARGEFARIVARGIDAALADLLEWACRWISLEPSESCDGASPLPLEYVDGEWIFGDLCTANTTPDAVVTYAEQPSESGSAGWIWWALGEMGGADSLRAAMAAAEAVVCKKGIGGP